MPAVSRRIWLAANVLFAVEMATNSRADEPKLPPFEEIEKTVEGYFQENRERREEDILSRSQVTDVLLQLEQLGWPVPDAKELISDVLDDQHVLVQTLRTPAGRRFLAKVAKRDLIYDRLDRISEVSGGPQLIRDLVKLPDGEKYAKPRSGGGVPDLLDLLPKNASGKTRRVKNYDEPTGHIYTTKDLLDRLAESHAKCQTH
jgi:hypothetical protein